ncbi:DUF5443 family protein [Mycoplasma amphoriforme]|uniref:DUF5443 family protein n=1 Tax=Mycoplasma amphoriforme TaxID=273136 RepID=UPI0031BA3820
MSIIMNTQITQRSVGHSLNSHASLWKLNPIDSNVGEKNQYFAAQIHAVSVTTTSTTIVFRIELLVNSKSILPNNIFLATVELPEFKQNNIPLKSKGFSNDKPEWTPYEINFAISKKNVSFGNDNLANLILPLKITFNPNLKLLESIQNYLEPLALKTWLDDLYRIDLSTQVRLDSFLQLNNHQGKTELYSQLPTHDNSGKQFTLTWSMNYYDHMKQLDQIIDLIKINSTMAMTITNFSFYFYYHVQDVDQYRTLKVEDNDWKKVEANSTFALRNPVKLLYDENKKVLFKEVVNGHDLFLPNGGQGYYELIFKTQVGNTFYNIKATNTFNYIRAFNDPKHLDFFNFEYQMINSLSGFVKV